MVRGRLSIVAAPSVDEGARGPARGTEPPPARIRVVVAEDAYVIREFLTATMSSSA